MSAPDRIPAPRSPVRGFTLTEIMVSMTVLSILMALFMSVYLDASRMAFLSEGKNLINRDVRNVTQQMSRTARSASYFALYRSFNYDDRDELSDQVLEGGTGDFVVFVFQGWPETGTQLSARPTERIVGYYRAVQNPDNSSEHAPVRKFEIDVPLADRHRSLEALLPPANKVHEYPMVVELSEGLANGDLFFNLWNSSLMVNGKIIHGNEAKRITETYNFTISPRGMQQ